MKPNRKKIKRYISNYLLLTCLALFLITSCEKAEQRYTQNSSEIESLKAMINAYDNKNWDALTQHYADTAKTIFNQSKPMNNQELIDYHQKNDAYYSSRGFVTNDSEYEMVITDDGETWVNFWGFWKGKLALNGEDFLTPIHLTARFIDGKLVRSYGYWNSAPLVQSLQKIEAENNIPVNEKLLKSLIKNMTEAWNTKNQDLFNASSTQNIVRTTNGENIVKNQSDYLEFMNYNFAAFPDFKVTMHKTETTNNKVIGYWTVTGTNTGKLGDQEPTNKKVKVNGLSVWTVNKDGKAIKEDAYYDSYAVYHQLGIPVPN